MQRDRTGWWRPYHAYARRSSKGLEDRLRRLALKRKRRSSKRKLLGSGLFRTIMGQSSLPATKRTPSCAKPPRAKVKSRPRSPVSFQSSMSIASATKSPTVMRRAARSLHAARRMADVIRANLRLVPSRPAASARAALELRLRTTERCRMRNRANDTWSIIRSTMTPADMGVGRLSSAMPTSLSSRTLCPFTSVLRAAPSSSSAITASEKSLLRRPVACQARLRSSICTALEHWNSDLNVFNRALLSVL